MFVVNIHSLLKKIQGPDMTKWEEHLTKKTRADLRQNDQQKQIRQDATNVKHWIACD